jgi:hypothetical protein
MAKIPILRKPDVVITLPNGSGIINYNLHFKRMILVTKEYEKFNNGTPEKTPWLVESYRLERWESNTGQIMWTASDGCEDKEFCINLFHEEFLTRLEQEYQNWLATKAIEKAIKHA